MLRLGGTGLRLDGTEKTETRKNENEMRLAIETIAGRDPNAGRTSVPNEHHTLLRDDQLRDV